MCLEILGMDKSNELMKTASKVSLAEQSLSKKPSGRLKLKNKSAFVSVGHASRLSDQRRHVDVCDPALSLNAHIFEKQPCVTVDADGIRFEPFEVDDVHAEICSLLPIEKDVAVIPFDSDGCIPRRTLHDNVFQIKVNVREDPIQSLVPFTCHRQGGA